MVFMQQVFMADKEAFYQIENPLLAQEEQV